MRLSSRIPLFNFPKEKHTYKPSFCLDNKLSQIHKDSDYQTKKSSNI